MKRIGTIATTLLLSVMIITLSVGVSFVYCCHYGKTETALAASDMHPEKEACGGCCDASSTETNTSRHACAPSAPCMSVKVAKLAPFNVAHQPVFDFQCTVQALPFNLFMDGAWLPATVEEKSDALIRPKPFVSPPHQYLRTLTTLLI